MVASTPWLQIGEISKTARVPASTHPLIPSSKASSPASVATSVATREYEEDEAFLICRVPSLATTISALSCSAFEGLNFVGFNIVHETVLRAYGFDESFTSIIYESFDHLLVGWLRRHTRYQLCSPPGYEGETKFRISPKTVTLIRDLIYLVDDLHSRGLTMKGSFGMENVVVTNDRPKLKDVMVVRVCDEGRISSDFFKVGSVIKSALGNIRHTWEVTNFVSLLSHPRNETERIVNHPLLWTYHERTDLLQGYYDDAHMYSASAPSLAGLMNKRSDKEDARNWESERKGERREENQWKLWMDVMNREPEMPISEFYEGRERKEGAYGLAAFLRNFRGHAGRFVPIYTKGFNMKDLDDMVYIAFPKVLVKMVKDLIHIRCFDLFPRSRGKK